MTTNYRVDDSSISQRLATCEQRPESVVEGTFTPACVKAVKRIPRNNVLRHLVDCSWNPTKVLIPFFHHHFSTKEGWIPQRGNDDLVFFALRGKYTRSQVPALASALVGYLDRYIKWYGSDGLKGSEEVVKLYAALAYMLPPCATVYFRGEHRDDKYFAQQGVEQILGLPVCRRDYHFNRTHRTWFYGVLSLWVNTIEPERAYFEIDGVLVARETLTRWLHDAKGDKFCSLGWQLGDVSMLHPKADGIKKQGIVNASHVDELMRGRVGTQDNSAHDALVIASNEDVLMRMKRAIGYRPKPTFSAVRTQILDLSRSRADVNSIREGLTHLAGLYRFVDETNNQLSESSKYTLQTLWAYANAHKSRQISQNLRDATLLQLAIIGREKPCIFGCVGHLLGTLQGIDPAFSVADDTLLIKERLREIAIRVQSQVDAQFEGTQLNDMDAVGALDEAAFSDIKVEVFRKTVDLELRCFDGVPPVFYQDEAEKLEAGFRI